MQSFIPKVVAAMADPRWWAGAGSAAGLFFGARCMRGQPPEERLVFAAAATPVGGLVGAAFGACLPYSWLLVPAATLAVWLEPRSPPPKKSRDDF